MGVSTNGFVLTENKDIFVVLNTIEKTLISLVRKYSQDVPIFRDSTSKLPRVECSPQSQFFNIYFTVKNESRILRVHFGCDGDYSRYGGSKIIWGVTSWGMSEEIILSICEVMKPFGKVFYEANDCDGEVVEVK